MLFKLFFPFLLLINMTFGDNYIPDKFPIEPVFNAGPRKGDILYIFYQLQDSDRDALISKDFFIYDLNKKAKFKLTKGDLYNLEKKKICDGRSLRRGFKINCPYRFFLDESRRGSRSMIFHFISREGDWFKIQDQRSGELWYVKPKEFAKMYYIKRPFKYYFHKMKEENKNYFLKKLETLALDAKKIESRDDLKKFLLKHYVKDEEEVKKALERMKLNDSYKRYSSKTHETIELSRLELTLTYFRNYFNLARSIEKLAYVVPPYYSRHGFVDYDKEGKFDLHSNIISLSDEILHDCSMRLSHGEVKIYSVVRGAFACATYDRYQDIPMAKRFKPVKKRIQRDKIVIPYAP